jgi:hypothetical protein
MAIDGLIAKKREEDAVFDVVRNMSLYDKTKPLVDINSLMSILKEKKLEPASELLHKKLDEARNTLERIDSEKAKKLADLQTELKKRKLE